jgi:hypothetical protein
MSKSIIELIESNEPSKVLSLVEKSLAKKLKTAIYEQTGEVAKDTYGTLEEYYGSDEQPDYVSRDDNNYAAFFANALKKFGVNGPEDFRDEETKKRFFQYVDANWKAQDAVQGSTQIGGGAGGFETGTQTRLPSPAMHPMPPNSREDQGGAEDPSVGTMAPAGPSIDKTQPLGADGDDPSLDMDAGAQKTQNLGDDPQQQQGDDQGGAAQGGIVCPHCHGTGVAEVCPTCGRPMDDESDPDLEIGDDDQVDDGENSSEFEENPEDEEGLENEENPEGEPGEEEQEEDPDEQFDDEDAYTANPNDFSSKEDGEEEPEDGEEEPVEDGEEPEEEPEDGEEEQDPDLEVGDEEEPVEKKKKKFPPVKESLTAKSYSRKQRKAEGTKKERKLAKKETRVKAIQEDDDFGFGLDNALDEAFVAEAIEGIDQQKAALQDAPAAELKPQKAAIDDNANKIKSLQKHLNGIKSARNQMLMSLRRQRKAINKDASMSPEKRNAANRALAKLAKQNRNHFKGQAQQIKALHTGQVV